ncbi:MAG: tRNA (guanosine(37)-N1)-methyltransferase TrmD [Spirochaetaceae bacterium]
MKVYFLSLFPAIPEAYFETSIMAKAVDRGIVDFESIDIRDFTTDRHRTCDDAPYGGGAGMVFKPEPLAAALDSVKAQHTRTVYPSPSGRLFNQDYAEDLAREEELVFICGRYEGIDQRIIDTYVDDEISLGDYVMSSGELAALVIIDSVYRLVEGVIKGESLEEESFTEGLLEYPHYTRPANFRGMTVPDVLLSGHHGEINRWRYSKRIEKTRRNRPDLLERRKKIPGEGENNEFGTGS